MRTDAGHVEGDVLDLAAVGDRTELDDRVEGDLQPGQVLFVRLQEVAQQAPERRLTLINKANNKIIYQKSTIVKPTLSKNCQIKNRGLEFMTGLKMFSVILIR